MGSRLDPGAVLRALEYANGHVDYAARLLGSRLLGLDAPELARHIEACDLGAYARGQRWAHRK